MSTIGERMRELRGASTLHEMADPIGIKFNAWSRYESGGALPGAEIITKICKIHACSADWLLGLKDTDSSSITLHGASSSIANGLHSSVTIGKGGQCSKCPFKRKLKQLEKVFKSQ